MLGNWIVYTLPIGQHAVGSLCFYDECDYAVAAKTWLVSIALAR